jgi:hypothetical protein
MRFMPTERARQRADTRTIAAFFAAMAVVLTGFVVVVAVHRLLFGG